MPAQETASPAQAPEAPRRLRIPPSWESRLSLELIASPALPLVLIAVVIFIWFAADEGGFRGTTWLPATLIFMGLLAIGLMVLPRPRPPRAAVLAAGLLLAYAAWSYLSILWADQQAIAWDGANRTLLYALVFALFALWPMRGGPAALVLGAFGLGVAAIGLVELLRVGGASQATQYFHEGRLSEPVGYVNANVALWFTAFWPCVILAGRREVHPALRGAFLGSAGLLASLAVLGQSRAWFFILPAVLVVVVAVVPGRGRTIAALAAVALGTLAILGPLLEVYDAFDPKGPPGGAWSDAVRSTLLVTVVLGLLGAGAALAERRIEVSSQTAWRVSAAMVAALVLAGVGGVGAVAVARGNPVTELSDAWKDLKEGEPDAGSEGSRFSSTLDTFRYDYWRVGWENFERHPIVGVGADNYGIDYIQRGKSEQTPLYPHSTPIRTLSETGLVGALLLFGAIAAALAAAFPGVRRGGGLGSAAAGAGVVVFAYWLVHGSVEWLWEYPGLGAPAAGMLGLAAAVGAARRPQAAGPPLPGGRWPTVAAVSLALVAALALAVPWLAERHLRKAREQAATDPAGALERLDRAARLNPLSSTPYQTAAVIEVGQGRLGAATANLERALERDPEDSFPYLELGAIASAQGRRAEAIRQVRQAHELAPRDFVTTEVLGLLQKGQRLTPTRVNAMIRSDRERRIGPE